MFCYTIFAIPSANFLLSLSKLFTFAPTSISHFRKFDYATDTTLTGRHVAVGPSTILHYHTRCYVLRWWLPL